jgi:periplasmic copper chaperone A
MSRILALLAAMLLSGPALAHEITVGDLQFIHPHIPEPPATAKSAGGYMAIVNSGTMAEVHESKVDANGIGTMAPVDALEIPAGSTVSLEQGGYHIMFMGLTGPLTEGEMHKATLIFERAGRVEITFQIDPPAGQGAAHNHGAADAAGD